MQDFKKLLVWQKAHKLAVLTYRLTADLPRDELFGLRKSLRKTSADIPAFIAEGCGKLNGVEAGRAVTGAVALANRLEYYESMARDLQILSAQNHDLLLEAAVEVRKMLAGFAKRIQGRQRLSS